jgi:hypothetical protein
MAGGRALIRFTRFGLRYVTFCYRDCVSFGGVGTDSSTIYRVYVSVNKLNRLQGSVKQSKTEAELLFQETPTFAQVNHKRR